MRPAEEPACCRPLLGELHVVEDDASDEILGQKIGAFCSTATLPATSTSSPLPHLSIFTCCSCVAVTADTRFVLQTRFSCCPLGLLRSVAIDSDFGSQSIRHTTNLRIDTKSIIANSTRTTAAVIIPGEDCRLLLSSLFTRHPRLGANERGASRPCHRS